MARRLHPDDRREEILDVAESVISASGYRGLSLRALSRACGMSAPGLLHYFDSNADVLTALLDRRDHRDSVAMLALATGSRSVRDLFDSLVAYNAAHPDGARLFAMVQAEAIDQEHPGNA